MILTYVINKLIIKKNFIRHTFTNTPSYHKDKHFPAHLREAM